MIRTHFLFAAVLGVAGLLATSNAAYAQRGRGPSHGPYRGGPSIRIGVGVGGFYGPGYYPYYSYGYAAPFYYPPTTVIVQRPPIVTTEAPPPYRPAISPDAAQIRVLVPDPNAKVWFDGNLTSQKGTDRLYHTPALTPGANNSYRIRVAFMQSGKEMIQERVVPVEGGKMSVADFTQPASEQIPPPPTK